MLQANQDMEIWRDKILPQTQQAVKSSETALQENGISLLLVLETTRQFLTAQQREREAEAQLWRAIAELERSVGHRLLGVAPGDPIHAERLPVPRVHVREDTP
jgi:cobalt-zinc-cadmium efflux system outer membrane protein